MYQEFKGLPEVLSELESFDSDSLQPIKEIMYSRSILQVMQDCMLSPTQILYFNSPLLENLYEAYFGIQLLPTANACVYPVQKPPESLDEFFLRVILKENFYLPAANFIFRQGIDIYNILRSQLKAGARNRYSPTDALCFTNLCEFCKTLPKNTWPTIMQIFLANSFEIPNYNLIKYLFENKDWDIGYLLKLSRTAVLPFTYAREKLYTYGVTQIQITQYCNGQKIVIDGIEYQDVTQTGRNFPENLVYYGHTAPLGPTGPPRNFNTLIPAGPQAFIGYNTLTINRPPT